VAWGYFNPDKVTIQEEPVTLHDPSGQEENDKHFINYTWKNKDAAFGHCASCGTTLYWKHTKDGAARWAQRGKQPTMAVNMKLLGPETLKTIKQEYGYE